MRRQRSRTSKFNANSKSSSTIRSVTVIDTFVATIFKKFMVNHRLLILTSEFLEAVISGNRDKQVKKKQEIEQYLSTYIKKKFFHAIVSRIFWEGIRKLNDQSEGETALDTDLLDKILDLFSSIQWI